MTIDVRGRMVRDYQPTKLGHTPWIIKANEMIAKACFSEYVYANLKRDGTRVRKVHVPYHVPEWVRPMIDAITQEDEREVKRIMMLVREGCLSLV